MRRKGAPCRVQKELSGHQTNVFGNMLRTTPNLNPKGRGDKSMAIKRGCFEDGVEASRASSA